MSIHDNHIRSILHVVAVALNILLTACTAAEEQLITTDTPTQEGKVPILFTQEPLPVSTRANTDYFVDGRKQFTIPNGKQIGMFGYYHGATNWNSVTGNHVANLFYNEPMTSVVNEEDMTVSFNYDKVRFWPGTSGEMCSFIAYYPYAANSVETNGIIIDPSTIGDGTNIGKIHFTTATDASEQIDFMVTELANDRTKLTNNARVGLNFKHMLACLQLKRGSDFNVENLIRIELPGIKTEGDCTIDYISGATTYTWDNPANPQTIKMTKEDFEKDPSFLIIPQTLTNVIAIINNAGVETPTSYTLNKVLQQGYKYTYTLGTPPASADVLDDLVLWGQADHRSDGIGVSPIEYPASNDVVGHPFGKDTKGNDIAITPGFTKMRIYYYNPNPSLGTFWIRLFNGADEQEFIGSIQPSSSGGSGSIARGEINSDPDKRVYVEFTITEEMLAKFNHTGSTGKCMRITMSNAAIMAIAFI